MGCNTVFNVLDPVNPHDVTENSGGFLKEIGGYYVSGYLNMGFNEIKNVKDPTEILNVANKNYVDKGKAIMQNPDGTFSAIADINMRGYTLTNLTDPANPQDIATKK